MAGSVNKVILIGNLGADPEVRSFPSGGKVANLRIATSETWKDRNTGERRERTEWHRVAIYSEPLVRVAEQYLRKGSKIYIEGKLETRKWQDQSGQDRYTTEIALRPYSSRALGRPAAGSRAAVRPADLTTRSRFKAGLSCDFGPAGRIFRRDFLLCCRGLSIFTKKKGVPFYLLPKHQSLPVESAGCGKTAANFAPKASRLKPESLGFPTN